MTVEIRPGVDPLSVVQATMGITAACAGRGRCGTCAVAVVGGDVPPPSSADRRWVSRDDIERGVRLACTLPVGIYTVSALRTPCAAVRHPYDRIFSPDLLPGPVGPGVAIDIGTTTVMATAFDELGMPGHVWATPNLQRSYGADVMSRVGAATEPSCALGLKVAVLESIATVLHASAGSKTPPAWIVSVGNTVMQHLAAGIDASPLGTYPYAPRPGAFRWRSVRIPGGEADTGWRAALVPPLGGLVGSDVIASIMHLRYHVGEEPWLLIDMGTNCEMVLLTEARLLLTSVPAGPAFEGGGLSWGCPAGDGAVEHVEPDGGAYRLAVIGGKDPVGLCGSAAIDLCALLRAGNRVEESGRLLGDRHVLLGSSGLSFTQRDIREIQKAKAAVELGVRGLLQEASLDLDDLRTVVLSGAFARGLDLENARAIGLIPWVDPGRLMVAGNTSLLGAGRCRDRRAMADLRLRGRRVTIHGGGFAERFADAVRLRPWG